MFRLQKEDNTLTEGAPSSQQQQQQQQQRDLIMALCGHHASIYYGEEVGERIGGRTGRYGTRRHDGGRR